MNMIRIATFSDHAHAVPLQKLLLAEGIPAEIHEKARFRKLWFIPTPQSGVRVEVPSDQYKQACRLTHKWDVPGGPLRGAFRCVECGSLKVDYPQFTRKFVLPNLVMGPAAALGLVEKQYYCEDCHYTWPKETARQHKQRAHMAPDYFIEGIKH
jgi:hypothetical protein